MHTGRAARIVMFDSASRLRNSDHESMEAHAVRMGPELALLSRLEPPSVRRVKALSALGAQAVQFQFTLSRSCRRRRQTFLSETWSRWMLCMKHGRQSTSARRRTTAGCLSRSKTATVLGCGRDPNSVRTSKRSGGVQDRQKKRYGRGVPK